MSFVLPWQEASLKTSPFAYVFGRAGLKSAELLINAVVVTSALSSANTFIYSCTRTLWSLGKHGQAFRALGRVNSKGVPVKALSVSMAFAILALVSSFVSPDVVYLFLISSIGLGNMFLYGLTCLCQYRFRKRYVAEGNSIDKLGFKVPLYPLLPVAGIVLYALLVLGMALDPTQRIALYTGIPLFIALYGAYRLTAGRKASV
jgi:arginine/ornithine permease